MTTPSIVDQVHAFIRDQILAGQDTGLSATTPLLELGILDSFGLFKLVAHLNETYPIDITAGEIVGRDFRNIESIASLVRRRLEDPSRAARPAATESSTEGVAVLEAPSCAQVFIMFLGQGQQEIDGRLVLDRAQPHLDAAPEFFKRAGLGDRNIILFHDASGRSYREGVSPSLPTRATIYERLNKWLAQRPWIEEVYCVGVSAGGPTAMLAGDFLKARTVWTFAPRTARHALARTTQQDLAAFVERVTGRPFQELQQKGLTPEDEARLDAQMTPEMVEAYYRSLVDPDTLLDGEQLSSVAETLACGNGVTEHRIYYVARDPCDARVVGALKHCSGVTLIPVEPSDAPAPQWTFSRWIPPVRWVCRDHLVLDLLRERGVFPTLFPPFRGVSTAVSA